eukprot:g63016.t1
MPQPPHTPPPAQCLSHLTHRHQLNAAATSHTATSSMPQPPHTPPPAHLTHRHQLNATATSHRHQLNASAQCLSHLSHLTDRHQLMQQPPHTPPPAQCNSHLTHRHQLNASATSHTATSSMPQPPHTPPPAQCHSASNSYSGQPNAYISINPESTCSDRRFYSYRNKCSDSKQVFGEGVSLRPVTRDFFFEPKPYSSILLRTAAASAYLTENGN